MVNLSMIVLLLGDVSAAQMPTVDVGNSHFSLIGAGVRVLTVSATPDQLAAVPLGTVLGPYGVEAPDTEVANHPDGIRGRADPP